MRWRLSVIAVVALAAGTASAASAAVVKAKEGGFVVRSEATVQVPPAKAYELFTTQVGGWWNGEHSYSGDPKNFSLEARPGGCFCERLADGGGIEHMRVVYVQPGSMLRMTGGLGPLQEAGVAGSLTLAFAATPGGAKVTLTYAAGGFIDGGFERLAPLVDRVLGEQLQRFATFADTGSPVATAPK